MTTEQAELTNLEPTEVPEVDQIDTAEYDIDQSIDQDVIEDDSEEIEFNSKPYKLPKEIASAVKDMQKDYTVKTQSLADQRREFESQIQFQQDNFKEYAQITALDERLAEFDQVDWNALVDNDPVLAQKLGIQRDALRSKRAQINTQLTQKFQTQKLEKQLSEAKQTEQAEIEIRSAIKNWSPELDKSLQEFAVKRYGFDPEYVRDYKSNPKAAKLLHDAYVGQQIIQKHTAKQKQIPDAKPVTNIAARSTTIKKSPADMTPQQYREWRKQGYR